VAFTASSAILTVNCIAGGTGIALALHEAGLMNATSIVIGVLAGTHHIHRPRLVPAATVQAGQGSRHGRVVTIGVALCPDVEFELCRKALSPVGVQSPRLCIPET
jgi:hypothetical protein